MNDKHMRTVSAFEQASAFLGIYAQFLFAYHRDLCNAGFQREEALLLVKEIPQMMFVEALKFNGAIEDED